MINLSSIDIAKKNLVVRVDMNVPIKDGHILDATRIEACIPTIKYAIKNNNWITKEIPGFLQKAIKLL